MSDFVIEPSKGLQGTLRVPGDKSISHRALIFSALASGTSLISSLLLGEDVLSTMRILQQLGVKMSSIPDTIKSSDTLEVYGVGLHGLKKSLQVLDCGNSGTSMRLFLGFLAAQPFESVLTGDASLNKRPMDRVMRPLEQMGARFHVEYDAQGRRLIHVYGNPELQGIDYSLPVASAQLKSALLLAGLYAKPSTRLVEPEITRDHSERMLAAMGAPLKKEGLNLHIQPCESLTPINLEVPGDFSSAAFFLVAGLIVPNSCVTLQQVGMNPSRIALLKVLQRMGGRIQVLNERMASGEPVADLRVESSVLKGIDIGGSDIPNLIDEIPVFAVAAALATGQSTVSQAEELRVKESDRIATVVSEFSRLGVAITEKQDGFVVQGGSKLVPGEVTSHGDHRIAMSLAILALRGDLPQKIADVDCVQTSFPGFLNLLRQMQS